MHDLATHTWAPRRSGTPAAASTRSSTPRNNSGPTSSWSTTPPTSTVGAPQVFFRPRLRVLDGDIVVDGRPTTSTTRTCPTACSTVPGRRPARPNSFTNYTGGLRQGSDGGPAAGQAQHRQRLAAVGRHLQPGQQRLLRLVDQRTSAGNSWTLLNQRDYTQPLNAKHGSIVGVTAAEYDGAGVPLGPPSWVRLKSYNFPDRYVRHANDVGPDRRLPLRPAPGPAVAHGPRPGRLCRRVVRVGQLPGPLPAALATTRSGWRPTTAPRRSAPTRPSSGPPAWPTPPGRRSGPTTSRTATCATPTTCCASTP